MKMQNSIKYDRDLPNSHVLNPGDFVKVIFFNGWPNKSLKKNVKNAFTFHIAKLVMILYCAHHLGTGYIKMLGWRNQISGTVSRTLDTGFPISRPLHKAWLSTKAAY